MPSPSPRARHRRRAELTFAANRERGRHGWLRLTPAYSVQLVEERLAGHQPGRRVLDPFCGSATTPVAAVARGHDALALDINPFLVWLGNAKLARYGPDARRRARAIADGAIASARSRRAPACEPPPIRNIERWWAPATLAALCRLKAAIDAGARRGSKARSLLTAAFCRTVVECSNAAFDHQSMSFRGDGGGRAPNALRRFDGDVDRLLASVADRPPGRGRVLEGDARRLDALEGEAPFDLVVTSPPYPNRMSYVRELRPYMYWTGHLEVSRDAGEIDWRAIGGTWGVATSRLGGWSRDAGVALPSELERCVEAIARSDAKNAELLSRYVARYFEDAARHLRALRPHLAPGARVHYVVGNSKFYDVLVPTERVYAALMRSAGLSHVAVRKLRKRNSKKELYEFDVTGRG